MAYALSGKVFRTHRSNWMMDLTPCNLVHSCNIVASSNYTRHRNDETRWSAFVINAQISGGLKAAGSSKRLPGIALFRQSHRRSGGPPNDAGSCTDWNFNTINSKARHVAFHTLDQRQIKNKNKDEEEEEK